MNTIFAATMGLLLVAFNVAGAGATETPRESARSPVKTGLGRACDINEKTDADEQATLQTYSSPALEKALLSSKTFWDFVIDPSTPYLDRMAAANRGGPILSPAELPMLWQALAEVNWVPPGWVTWVPSGVNPWPCSALALEVPPPTLAALGALQPGSHRSPEQSVRMVLGHYVQLPAKNIDYPVTAEERDHSPWIWQMERALSLLFEKTNLYYGDQSRYPERVKAAWSWPLSVSTYRGPGDVLHNLDLVEWSKIRIRSQALTEGAPHDALLLQTVIKLALNDDNYEIAYSAPVSDLSAWGQYSYHFEELAHVAQIVILQKTKWENVAGQTAFVTANLARLDPDPVRVPHIKPLQTATAILAIGRWATDKSLNPWNRYYEFVNPICRIVDDPPFTPYQIRDPKDPRIGEALNTFDAWFKKKKPALEQQAGMERPHLQLLAKELLIEIE